MSEGIVQAASTRGARIAFRVDVSADIGAGHLTRCVALARAMGSSLSQATFICARLPADMERSIEALGFGVKRIPLVESRNATQPFRVEQGADADAVLRAIGDTRFDWIVPDHYGLDAVWESRVRPAVGGIFVIDDLADRDHDADLLLDQNIQDSPDRYSARVRPGCRLLLGPKFALLRPDFAAVRAQRGTDVSDLPPRVLLFAGGGDPQNATGRVLDAWALLDATRPPLEVIIGSAHPFADAIRARCAKLLNVELHVQTEQMAQLLSRTTLLIGAAGSVSWERCALGVPSLMFTIAANQELNLRMLAARRTGLSLGRAADLEPARLADLLRRVLPRSSLLRRMGRRAAQVTDGLGATRVALAMGVDAVTLRYARPEEDATTWPWRNHPATRRYFRDPRALSLEEHCAWWRRAVADPGRRLFVASCLGRDIGVLRLDLEGSSAEVSIYLNPDFTGLGLGPAILRAAQRWSSAGDVPLASLRAEILQGNRASTRAFEAAGFRRQGNASHWFWEIAR